MVSSNDLVFRGLHFLFRLRERLSRFRWRRHWGDWRNGRGPANFDSLVLVVDDDVGRAISHAAGGAAFVFIVGEFQLWKFGLNLAAAGARIETESGFLRDSELHFSIAVVDLHVAQRAHDQLDGSVVVFQAHVAGDAFEAYVFRASGQTHRAGYFIGMELVGIQIKRASELGKFHVGARRLEGDSLGDTLELHAFLKFAFELHRAFHVGHSDVVHSTADLHVSGDLLDFDGALLLADLDVRGDILDRGVGMLR